MEFIKSLRDGNKRRCQLSGAGREVLIKAAAQTIPNYIACCYKIHEGCCDQIERMVANFWWGLRRDRGKSIGLDESGWQSRRAKKAYDSGVWVEKWRSILSARDILNSSCKWKISDGRKVQIWKDYWVPTKRPKRYRCP